MKYSDQIFFRFRKFRTSFKKFVRKQCPNFILPTVLKQEPLEKSMARFDSGRFSYALVYVHDGSEFYVFAQIFGSTRKNKDGHYDKNCFALYQAVWYWTFPDQRFRKLARHAHTRRKASNMSNKHYL